MGKGLRIEFLSSRCEIRAHRDLLPGNLSPLTGVLFCASFRMAHKHALSGQLTRTCCPGLGSLTRLCRNENLVCPKAFRAQPLQYPPYILKINLVSK